MDSVEYTKKCRGLSLISGGLDSQLAICVLRDAGAGQMYDWDEKEELLAFLDAEHPQAAGIEKYTRRALTERLAEVL